MDSQGACKKYYDSASALHAVNRFQRPPVMRMFGAAVLNTSTGHISETALVRQLLGYVTDWRIHLGSACTHPLVSDRGETLGAAIPKPDLSGSASFATLCITTADSHYSCWHCLQFTCHVDKTPLPS